MTTSSTGSSPDSASGNKPEVRCSVCLATTAAARCECGATMNEDKHRELAGVYYLLGQMGRWQAERSVAAPVIHDLRGRYQEKREAIKSELMQRPAPAAARDVRELARKLHLQAAPEIETGALCCVKCGKELRHGVAECDCVRPETTPPPRPPPAPVAEPVTLRDVVKNLFTERNVRWMLNLGIFIVAVGLIVFIHTQWGAMGGAAKTAILFGGTGLVFLAGHLLQRTTLKITGLALVVLACLGLPIDFAGMAAFKVLPVKGEWIGLAGAVLSTLVYAGLASTQRVATFSLLAWLGGIATWIYGAKVLGASYAQVAPLVPLLLLGYAIAERRSSTLWRRPLLWVTLIRLDDEDRLIFCNPDD